MSVGSDRWHDKCRRCEHERAEHLTHTTGCYHRSQFTSQPCSCDGFQEPMIPQMLCEHANEVPLHCPCPSHCACRLEGSCRDRAPQVIGVDWAAPGESQSAVAVGYVNQGTGRQPTLSQQFDFSASQLSQLAQVAAQTGLSFESVTRAANELARTMMGQPPPQAPPPPTLDPLPSQIPRDRVFDGKKWTLSHCLYHKDKTEAVYVRHGARRAVYYVPAEPFVRRPSPAVVLNVCACDHLKQQHKPNGGACLSHNGGSYCACDAYEPKHQPKADATRAIRVREDE